MTDLSNMTTQQLKLEMEKLGAELAAREELKKEAVREKRRARVDFLMQHIDELLLLQPKHSRTSCNDNKVINDARGCTRCFLLCAKSSFWDTNRDLNLTIVTLPSLD